MAETADKPTPFDPFGIAASMNEWCCLLKAAEELEKIDTEMMETMLEAEAPNPVTLSPEAAAKIRSVATLMRRLNLDPEAIRRQRPEAMRELEAACVNCRERRRCARDLWTGTATATYPEFCPNAVRLDQLRRA